MSNFIDLTDDDNMAESHLGSNTVSSKRQRTDDQSAPQPSESSSRMSGFSAALVNQPLFTLNQMQHKLSPQNPQLMSQVFDRGKCRYVQFRLQNI